MSASGATAGPAREREPARASRASRARAREHGADESAGAPPVSLQRGLALGVLAMVPLFVTYEIAAARSGGALRNAAEVILTLPFATLGFDPAPVRAGGLVLAVLASAWIVFHERLGLFLRVGRVVAEGAAAALVLGPLLIVVQKALALEAPAALASASSGSAPLGASLVVVSGAAFEEIVFRVGLQSALFVLALEAGSFYLRGPAVARGLAEVVSTLLSALAFAALHLGAFLRPLGAGGEAWDPALFAWRFLAGVMLSILFRWRGAGVAAWAHAFFNLALFVGAGPDVFL